MATKSRRGRTFGDAQGSSALLGLLVGTGLFSVTFATVVTVSQHELARAPETQMAVAAETDAHRLALEILSQPGSGWYDRACTGLSLDFTPEKLRRFGLASDACGLTPPVGLNLSYEKLQNIRRASLAASPGSGTVDYEEAKASLGLTDRDFHVRARVALAEAEALLRHGYQDHYLSVLYVGDYEKVARGGPGGGNPNGGGPGGAPSPPSSVCSKTAVTNGVDAWIEITNTGITDAAFHASFSLKLKKGTLETVKWSPVIAPDASAKIVLHLPQSNDWDWKGQAEIDVKLFDSDGQLDACTIDLRDSHLFSLDARVLLMADEADLRAHAEGRASLIHYRAYDGRGEAAFSLTHALHATGVLGHVGATAVIALNAAYTVEAPLADASYDVQLRDPLGRVIGKDPLRVPPSDPGSYTPASLQDIYAPGPSTVAEVAYLDRLLSQFDARVADPAFATLQIPYDAGGDVLPDVKSSLDARLPPSSATTSSSSAATSTTPPSPAPSSSRPSTSGCAPAASSSPSAPNAKPSNGRSPSSTSASKTPPAPRKSSNQTTPSFASPTRSDPRTLTTTARRGA
jgi:hypothetical protein